VRKLKLEVLVWSSLQAVSQIATTVKKLFLDEAGEVNEKGLLVSFFGECAIFVAVFLVGPVVAGKLSELQKILDSLLDLLSTS